MAFQYSRKQVGEKILKEATEAFLDGARCAAIREIYRGQLRGYNSAWFWLNSEAGRGAEYHPLIERMVHALIELADANLPDDPELRGDMTNVEFALWFADRKKEQRLARQ